METKITEGIWIKRPAKNGVIEIVNEYGVLICEIDYIPNKYNSPTPIGAESNAKLISAAPDLLEALVELIDDYNFEKGNSFYNSIIEKAKQAIKKATE